MATQDNSPPSDAPNTEEWWDTYEGLGIPHLEEDCFTCLGHNVTDGSPCLNQVPLTSRNTVDFLFRVPLGLSPSSSGFGPSLRQAANRCVCTDHWFQAGEVLEKWKAKIAAGNVSATTDAGDQVQPNGSDADKFISEPIDQGQKDQTQKQQDEEQQREVLKREIDLACRLEDDAAKNLNKAQELSKREYECLRRELKCMEKERNVSLRELELKLEWLKKDNYWRGHTRDWEIRRRREREEWIRVAKAWEAVLRDRTVRLVGWMRFITNVAQAVNAQYLAGDIRRQH